MGPGRPDRQRKPALNLFCQNVPSDGFRFHLLYDCPSWTLCTLPRGPVIQAINKTLAHLQPLLVARHVSGSQPLCPRLYHAISKLPRHLPEGKLQLLSIPLKPWSHIGVDFITSSESFTCILVVVDRISKACRLIPLTGLPSAIVTVEALFTYMFRNYSLPADIVLIWTSVHLQSK